MSSIRNSDVLIVGGGPVGLLLAVLLGRTGITCPVLEKRPAPSRTSRAIGIHAPGMEAFRAAGLLDRVLEAGHRITSGRATGHNGHELGTMDFTRGVDDFPFILSLPQWRTEQLLDEAVRAMDSVQVHRGVCPESMTVEAEGVQVHSPQGTFHARYVVGCDGRDSWVRAQLGIPFSGFTYADCYVMGDYSDTLPERNRAEIFLHGDGLVEAIPLPDDVRRWVVRLPGPDDVADAAVLEKWVRDRTGHDLAGCERTMFSAFGVQRYMAERFVQGRVALAGDAAHVMSPIGGQGMNVGWMDAMDLAQSLKQAIQHSDTSSAWGDYPETARVRALRASRQGAFNMRLGRPTRFPVVRDRIVRLMLGPLGRNLFHRRFTMRS